MTSRNIFEDERRKVDKTIADLESTRTCDQREPILAELDLSSSKHGNVEQEPIYPHRRGLSWFRQSPRTQKKKHDIAAEIAAVGRPHQLETQHEEDPADENHCIDTVSGGSASSQ